MDQQDRPSPRSRGRPARSPLQIEDMRQHIAECASRLFRDEGFAAVSMRKLAAEAGCTPKTLYAYFASKLDVLSLLWSEVFATLFDQLDARAAGLPDPRARLEAVANDYVAYWLQHRDAYFLVFMSTGLTRPDVEAFVATGSPRARFDLFARCLAEARGPGGPAGDLQARAEALVCALNGIAQAHITMSGHPWTPATALVRRAVAGALA